VGLLLNFDDLPPEQRAQFEKQYAEELVPLLDALPLPVFTETPENPPLTQKTVLRACFMDSRPAIWLEWDPSAPVK
jgi:hypothetical protein